MAEGDGGHIQRDSILPLRVNGAANDIWIPGDHRAVIGIVGVAELALLVKDHRVKDAVNAGLDQVHDVPADQLARKAQVFGHDVHRPTLVQSIAGGGREVHLDAAFQEQGVPEGVVLEHIEHPWNADLQEGLAGRGGRAVEQQVVLEVGDADPFALGFAAVGVDALAAVAREEAVAVGETQLGHRALVLTAPAADILAHVLAQPIHVLETHKGAGLLRAVQVAVSRRQRRAVGAHQLG